MKLSLIHICVYKRQRIGRVRTSTDYQNTAKFPALQRTIDAMPVSDEQQQLQYMLEAVEMCIRDRPHPGSRARCPE